MMGSFRLVDPTTDVELVAVGEDPDGLILTNLDLGFPDVRDVATPFSGADGESDGTRFVGGRAITTEVVCAYEKQADRNRWVDRMSGLMHPGYRLWLYVLVDGWDSERRIKVRGATFSRTAVPPVTVQMGWKAAAGVFEDSVVSSQVLSPAGGNEGGAAFPRTFPRSYGAGVVPGYAYVDVGGTVATPPWIDIYGPCTSPSVRLIGTGQTIAFTGLTIAAGNFLRVNLDPTQRTVYLNGDPTQSRYGSLNFTISQWWSLPPGPQQLLFAPSSPGRGCQAVVSWRNRTIAA